MRLFSSGLGARATLLLLFGGCTAADSLARAHEPYDQFARNFITDLQEHGPDGIRNRVKSATLRDSLAAEQAFAAMIAALPSSIDSIRPHGEWQVEENGSNGVAQLYYRVFGPDRAADVRMWVERKGKHFEAETVGVNSVQE
jgi:hypothetical protein